MQTRKELVPAVRHLVEYERSSLAAADTIKAAQGVVASQPDTLLHRIVSQFQHLFDCPRLEGVLPAMNQVRTTLTCIGIGTAGCTVSQKIYDAMLMTRPPLTNMQHVIVIAAQECSHSYASSVSAQQQAGMQSHACNACK